MDDGARPIEDPGELATIRAQSRVVQRRALVTAVALTVLSLLLP